MIRLSDEEFIPLWAITGRYLDECKISISLSPEGKLWDYWKKEKEITKELFQKLSDAKEAYLN